MCKGYNKTCTVVFHRSVYSLHHQLAERIVPWKYCLGWCMSLVKNRLIILSIPKRHSLKSPSNFTSAAFNMQHDLSLMSQKVLKLLLPPIDAQNFPESNV